MADRLEVVAVGVDHEGSVIVRVIVRSQARHAVVSGTGDQCGLVEGVNSGVIRRRQGHMDARRLRVRGADPESGRTVSAKARAALPGRQPGVTQRRQGRLVKARERVELCGPKSNMVEHDEFLLSIRNRPGNYLEREISVVPAQISAAPPPTIERFSERHSPKARAPTVTATNALALVNEATTATGSFSTPKP